MWVRDAQSVGVAELIKGPSKSHAMAKTVMVETRDRMTPTRPETWGSSTAPQIRLAYVEIADLPAVLFRTRASFKEYGVW